MWKDGAKMNIKQEVYDNLVQTINGYKLEVEKLSKEKTSMESTNKYLRDRAESAEKSLEQMHSLLDVMDGSGTRKLEDGYTSREPMTRLAQWLASKVRV